MRQVIFYSGPFLAVLTQVAMLLYVGLGLYDLEVQLEDEGDILKVSEFIATQLG